MPNILPPGRNPRPLKRDQHPSLSNSQPEKKVRNPNSPKDLEKSIENIESRYWHNRLISYCIKTINRVMHPPKPYLIQELVLELSKSHGVNNKAKILAALKLHCDKGSKNISLKPEASVTIYGTIHLTPESIDKVKKSLTLSPVEIGYEFYRKGKHVPEGFVEYLLIPELAERTYLSIKELEKNNQPLTNLQTSITSVEKARELVIIEAQKSGIKSDKNFSFERMLKLKQGIRNNIAISLDEQKHNQQVKHDEENISSSSTIPSDEPTLTPPKAKNHHIDKEDRQYIKKVVTQDRFFSWISVQDFANRAKRMVLRNKLHGAVLLASVISTVILTVIFPPVGVPLGIAVMVGVGIEMTYISFWSGGGSLWGRFRVFTSLKLLKKYSNFKYESLDPRNDKKRTRLIKKLATICEIKSFTQIYNKYAELEKLSDKINTLAQEDNQSLSHSIKLEKLRALYKKRHKKLFTNMLFFDQLRENIIINKVIIEDRLRNNLIELWQEKFAHKSQTEVERIFAIANKHENILIHNRKINTSNEKWLAKAIPHWMSNLDTGNHEKPDSSHPTNSALLKKQKLSFITTTKHFAKSFGATISKSTAKRQAKRLVFYNATNVIEKVTNKVAFRSIIGFDNESTLNFSHLNPFHDLRNSSSYMSFIITFLLEVAASAANQRINKAKLKEIESGKKGMTFNLPGLQWRPRTGREEVSTLRALSKNEVEPMVQFLMDAMFEAEKTNKKLKKAKLSAPLNSISNYDSISDQAAASYILKYVIWNQLMAEKNKNVVELFFKDVLKKTEERQKSVSGSLNFRGKKPLSIKQKTPTALNYMTNIDKSSGPPGEFLASNSIYLEPSDVILQRIRNHPSGKLIVALIQKNISENQAIQTVHSLNLDELRMLQLWINYAIQENGLLAHKKIISKIDRIVVEVIQQRYNHSS